MPHNITLITTISVSLGFALLLGLIAVRLKLPALVGYLLAGILIGPNTTGFIVHVELSIQLAEIGIVMMMFGIGLHFSLRDLIAVQRIALPGALAQITVATIFSAGIAAYWNWNLGEGLVLGLALSVASTVVLLRGLEQYNLSHSVNGKIAVGWLVVEDLTMVLVLLLLPALSGWLGGKISPVTSSSHWELLQIVLITIGKMSIFIVFMLFGGRKLFPWLLWQVAGTGSRELFILCVIATAVGIAYGSAELFGVSFALGAFFAGMVMRESPLSQRAAEESLPMRDAFSVLFFVSVGMLFDPYILMEQPLKVLVVVAIIIFGKSLAAFLIVLAFRYPLNTALTVSAGLAQIGEFSFILANFGVSLGIFSNEGQNLILAGALISISLNSLVFRAIEPAQVWIRSRSGIARLLERPEDPLAELPMSVNLQSITGHVIIVGYGLVGQKICEYCIKEGISFVVAEQNRDAVQQLRESGFQAVSGDVIEPNVLIQAHIARASSLIITIPDMLRVRGMIEIAHILNPKVEIAIRAHSVEESEMLRHENAGKVFISEHELAFSMTNYLLKKINPKFGSSLEA
ncbi:putative cation/proton antiporter YbaL [Gammaproteobacteria bacterium]